ncbi:hypothetical protein FisN_34Lh016 [Fistulifera solaris]|uniref:NAD(P)-binding domain-containing protein n=1 Tax=Fistulifera solaris TaxID=1519565 RepID=A0A1Z5JHD3_FISSO|nr:hypothetical protein FisN_34Lh016 [Fistulifera solaris]|eukprot:GAX13417.1 hypothetical protein FisN_34Lh016 [Fistulifera solaris]
MRKVRVVSTMILGLSFSQALLFKKSKTRIPSLQQAWHDSSYSYERDIPTETMAALPEPAVMPSQPKIVVLGATGKIGRLVVRQLLETNGEATIVAVVHDYDKACRVLYDDLITVNKKKQPALQIVEANLVPPEELPGYRDTDEEEEEEEEWRKRASSAAAFYGTSIQDYNNQHAYPADEVLEDAIRGCTAIISCVGSVRPTNLWTDFLLLWRVWRKDVSAWCSDARHPYYVHYRSTRKALALAEKEQLRRQSLQTLQEDDTLKRKTDNKVPSRIRFVRISDLCLQQQPWHFVPLLTNIMHSMVFRYQDMTEQLLQSCNLIDTIILRPGDLSDDERNVNTTGLQVDPSGRLPSPSRVGREDVASLAVSSALFRLPNATHAAHYTLAVRWVGEDLHPYPAQGTMKDGFASAHACLRHVFQKKIVSTARRRNIKPYALCTTIPVYAMLFLLLRSLTHSLLPLVLSYLPGRNILFPFFSRIGKLVALVCGVLAGQLGALQQISSPRFFAKSAPKFISF